MKTCRPLFTARGFTTYELLMAIVVVGILATMAYPRFVEVRERSHVGAARCDLVAVRQALAMYATEHNGYPAGVASYEELKSAAVDPTGNAYMALPVNPTFRWISYNSSRNDNYLIIVQALNNEGTLIRATAEGITVG